MKKRLTLILGIFLVLLVSQGVLAELTSSVCCEKTTDGSWCQNAQESQCNTQFRAAATSCSQTSFCTLGTCVNPSKGTCSANTPESVCSEDGGTWYDKDKAEVAICAPGCCQIGDGTAFVSQTECKQLASDYGVDVNFRTDITDEPSCIALSSTKELGACVFEDLSSDCTVTTKESCVSKKGTFHKDLLCTAEGLSDCAKSDELTCYDDDVYFLDTCGNRANIYDPSMYSSSKNGWSKEMIDYWTDIKKDYSDKDYLGDCDYTAGTVCKEEKGNYFCNDMSCEYDTNDDGKIDSGEIYKHGESWCAESKGTSKIQVDTQTMAFLDEKDLEEIRTGEDKYNLPGSRYYKLQCWEGEVIVEPCADFRNEVCKEGLIGENKDFLTAQCRTNDWRTCLTITDKDTCEDQYTDCKWQEGYRFDLTRLTNEDDIKSSQGSCVPLYAPGFDFWNEGNSGVEVCEMGSVVETVLYETNWLSEKRSDLKKKLSEATQNCYGQCYAIPGYAKDIEVDPLKQIHLGSRDFDKGKLISDRLGYYCEGKTGAVNTLELDFSKKIKCASSKDQPLFYRNQEWLNSITARASSLGDCGYKKNFVGTDGQNSTEIITSLFQEMKQNGEVKKNSSVDTIYKGNNWVDKDDKRITEVMKK